MRVSRACIVIVTLTSSSALFVACLMSRFVSFVILLGGLVPTELRTKERIN